MGAMMLLAAALLASSAAASGGAAAAPTIVYVTCDMNNAASGHHFDKEITGMDYMLVVTYEGAWKRELMGLAVGESKFPEDAVCSIVNGAVVATSESATVAGIVTDHAEMDGTGKFRVPVAECTTKRMLTVISAGGHFKNQAATPCSTVAATLGEAAGATVVLEFPGTKGDDIGMSAVKRWVANELLNGKDMEKDAFTLTVAGVYTPVIGFMVDGAAEFTPEGPNSNAYVTVQVPADTFDASMELVREIRKTFKKDNTNQGLGRRGRHTVPKNAMMPGFPHITLKDSHVTRTFAASINIYGRLKDPVTGYGYKGYFTKYSHPDISVYFEWDIYGEENVNGLCWDWCLEQAKLPDSEISNPENRMDKSVGWSTIDSSGECYCYAGGDNDAIFATEEWACTGDHYTMVANAFLDKASINAAVDITCPPFKFE